MPELRLYGRRWHIASGRFYKPRGTTPWSPSTARACVRAAFGNKKLKNANKGLWVTVCSPQTPFLSSPACFRRPTLASSPPSSPVRRACGWWRQRACLGQLMFACRSPTVPTSHAGAYNIETTGIQNSCDVGAQVRVAVYGIFAIFIVSAIVEMSIASVGLKGLCVFWMRPGCLGRGGTATN